MLDDHYTLSLAVQALDARRGGQVVANGISFSLLPGEALTLRGENGTGKTSILRAIAGFSRHDDPSVRFSEREAPIDPAECRASHIHWLGGGDGLADKLSVLENSRSWQMLHMVEQTECETTLSRLGLMSLLHRPAGKLSTGQRRRLGLARLLLSPKALWLLDEPMNGLDWVGRDLLLSAVADHRALGGIVLMASHEDSLPGSNILRLQKDS